MADFYALFDDLQPALHAFVQLGSKGEISVLWCVTTKGTNRVEEDRERKGERQKLPLSLRRIPRRKRDMGIDRVSEALWQTC